MFNAIFGNFLFSSKAAPVTEEHSKCLATEASTQTTSISAATQTGFDVQIGVGSNDDNNAMTDMSISTTLKNTKSTSTGTTNQLDWVIIDPSEGNIDHLMDESQLEHKTVQNAENLVEMGCENEPADWKRTNEDNDVLLGSFFDKNEHEEPSIMSKLFRSGLGLNENFDQLEKHNEIDANQTKKPTTEDPTWLITPLPCLTSITESSHQRSMIDNYPLENLLIEHPSMSVFISATNSQQKNNKSLPVATSSSSPLRQQKQLSQSVSLPLINVSNQIEVTKMDNICCEMKISKDEEEKREENNEIKKKNKKANKKNNRKPNRKVPRRSVKFEKKSMVADCDLEPIIFTIGDDEVTCEQQPAALTEKQVAVKEEESLAAVEVAVVEILEVAVEQQIESANSSIQLSRKSKKSKKSKASPSTQIAKSTLKSSNNKENMQVKTLLLNESKKCVSPITHHNCNRFELSLLNKNQMKRNNKNSTFSSLRNNVNSNQRKYHKLQQPSFSVNIQQF